MSNKGITDEEVTFWIVMLVVVGAGMYFLDAIIRWVVGG